jgi:hypothetical protein
MSENVTKKITEQQILFDDRFLEKYIGNKLLTDPVTAIIELIANSWDAGATEVHVQWPEDKNDTFVIRDNGCGLTEVEFLKIWSTMAYDRTKCNGKYASGDTLTPQRIAFGRNGIGRFAGFCFADEYTVIGKTKISPVFNYAVTSTVSGKPFELKKINSNKSLEIHGLQISAKDANTHGKSTDNIRSEIGMRFFSNANFKVFVQNKLISFEDISTNNFNKETLKIGENEVTIITIDTKESDKNTKHHGVAWEVNHRLVGNITWDDLSNQYNVDGRRVESRRYSFCVVADFLDNYILPDWSGFDKTYTIVIDTLTLVYQHIWKKMIELTKDQREESFNKVKLSLNNQYQKMTPLKKEKWEHFLKNVQEKCPSLTEPELEVLGSVLANLEISHNKFELLNRLGDLEPDELDELNKILRDYSLQYAKEILDEIGGRLKLLKQLECVLYAKKADEVHELQPLFQQGLWIFGPEFESIEYTSNRGMTTVIQELFGGKLIGSLNRPDFVIKPDSSVGLYSRPSYDENSEVIGVEKLVIIELKSPGIKLTDEEITQPKKYALELFKKGLLQNGSSKVTCFVIGNSIETGLGGEETARDGSIVIRPMLYDTVLNRARRRLCNLYDKIKEAPFMKEIDSSYTKEIEDAKQELF